MTALAAQSRTGVRGFTYLGILLLLGVVTLVGTAGLKWGAVSHRRGAEQALLDTGAAFSAALRSYARATPRGQVDAPGTLQDLLKDPRFPATVRHLRRVFVDPMTGKSEWGLVRNEQGNAILGVYSLAKGQPIKLANFDSRFSGFNAKLSYREWEFVGSVESDANGVGLSRGLVSGGVLRGERSAPIDTAPTGSVVISDPRSISHQGLR